MSWLKNFSIFIGILSAVLVMIEKYSPDMSRKITFQDLTPKIKEWHKKGSFYNVHGHKMFAIVEGNGAETIILVHGFPCSSFDYNKGLDYLTKDHRVVMFDLLGYGFSDKPKEGFVYSMADQADMALTLWKEMGIKSAHIVAHDMGDSVVTEILSRRDRKMLPEYFDNFFKSVTFTNGGMYYEKINMRLTQQLLTIPVIGPFLSSLKQKLPFNISQEFFKIQLKSIWSPLYDNNEDRDQDIDDMLMLLELNGGSDILHKTITYLNDRARFEERWLSALSRLDIKIMLFWGDNDSVAPMEIPKTLALKYMPEGKFVGKTMKNAGHFIMLENPKAWAETIIQFISESKEQ